VLLGVGLACGGGAFALTRYALNPAVETLRLQPELAVVDLGSVPQGTAQARFELTNRSDALLTIAHVETTCRCTQVSVGQKVLSPGARTTVQCQWNTASLRGRAGSTFKVYYACGGSAVGGRTFEVLPLRVEADVVPPFDYSPSELRFTPNGRTTRTVDLRSRAGASPVIVESMYCTHAAFKAGVQTPTCVVVTFDPREWSTEVGSYPEVRITTDCPTNREIRIPLRVDTSTPSGHGSGDSPSLVSGAEP
jgi:hypothetical protein